LTKGDKITDVKILGIESSCDETAAAVVEDGFRLLSNVVATQIKIHQLYGGVVPEVAARSHLEVVLPVIDKAVLESYLSCHPELVSGFNKKDLINSDWIPQQVRNDIAEKAWFEIDAIACTTMPGLIGSLLIGSLTARTLALIKNKPFYPIHHVEGHVYANFLIEIPENIPGVIPREVAESSQKNIDSATNKLAQNDTPEFIKIRKTQPEFPMLALIVSGGHSQIVLFRDHGDYELIGQTADDAVGEAFDKVAKILGLPYPGGPSIDKAAENGDPHKYQFPKAHMQNPYDFSFSGLKTAVLRRVQAEVGKDHTFPSNGLSELLTTQQRNDFAASFLNIAVETLVDKVVKAYHEFQPKSVVIAGGVAADPELRRQLKERLPIPIEYPPMKFCTDNAAMIASLGYFVSREKSPTDPRDVEVLPSISMTKTAWSVSRL